MDIGSRIRSARKARGLTQEELARRADMSLVGMGDIERGVIKDPHYSSLSKIAAGLGVSVGELLEEPVPLGEGPLSPEWAYRVDPDVFRLRIRQAPSSELRELGEALVAEFYRTRTREELVEEGPKPEERKVRAFSLAGAINEELLYRGADPLDEYALAFRKFAAAMSGGEAAPVREEEDREHRAG